MPDARQAAVPPPTLYGQAFKANPFPAYAALRREGAVCYRAGFTGTNMVWFVTRYAEARQVLRDHTRFVKDYRNTLTPAERRALAPEPRLIRYVTHHLLRRDAEDHARLRGLLAPVFQKRHIDRMRPRVQQIADALLDAVAPHGQMDLISDFAFPLPVQVIAELIGLPTDDLAQFGRWARSIIIERLETMPREALRERAAFLDYLEACFEDRRAAPRDDLMTRLVGYEQAGQLSREELFSLTAVLITAGHETTVRFIGNSLLALLQQPEHLAALQADPARLDPALEELLRLEGSVERATTRFAAEDVTLAGCRIRRGDAVVVLLASADRDERVFAQPARLDMNRKPCPHLAFGAGPHYCIGAALARMEAQVAIGTVLRRLPRLRLAVPPNTLEWVTVPALRGVRRLPVRWD